MRGSSESPAGGWLPEPARSRRGRSEPSGRRLRGSSESPAGRRRAEPARSRRGRSEPARLRRRSKRARRRSRRLLTERAACARGRLPERAPAAGRGRAERAWSRGGRRGGGTERARRRRSRKAAPRGLLCGLPKRGWARVCGWARLAERASLGLGRRLAESSARRGTESAGGRGAESSARGRRGWGAESAGGRGAESSAGGGAERATRGRRRGGAERASRGRAESARRGLRAESARRGLRSEGLRCDRGEDGGEVRRRSEGCALTVRGVGRSRHGGVAGSVLTELCGWAPNAGVPPPPKGCDVGNGHGSEAIGRGQDTCRARGFQSARAGTRGGRFEMAGAVGHDGGGGLTEAAPPPPNIALAPTSLRQHGEVQRCYAASAVRVVCANNLRRPLAGETNPHQTPAAVGVRCLQEEIFDACTLHPSLRFDFDVRF